MPEDEHLRSYHLFIRWQPYRVVNGRAVGLLLNEEESNWLKHVWAEATSK